MAHACVYVPADWPLFLGQILSDACAHNPADVAHTLFCCCLQGAHVAEWVKHALGLPQYVQAFRDNAVSVSDSCQQCLSAAVSCATAVLTVHTSHCPAWRCRAYIALGVYAGVRLPPAGKRWRRNPEG